MLRHRPLFTHSCQRLSPLVNYNFNYFKDYQEKIPNKYRALLSCISSSVFGKKNLSMSSSNELACIYAALILSDDQVAVTIDKLVTILKAANVSVEPYWPTLFALALEDVDIKSLLTQVGNMAAPAAAAATGGDSAPAASREKEAEKKKEESEESDDDMGFGLFD